MNNGSLFGLLADLLYPPRCRYCRDAISGPDERFFCPECSRQVQPITHPLCPTCGMPFIHGAGDDHLCGICVARRPVFTLARAWACYPKGEAGRSPLRSVVQQFKYGKKVSLGAPLGRILAAGCRSYFEQIPIDCIVPVPLHRSRLRWRGFNQAAILSREVGRSWGIAVDPFVLTRTRETSAQTDLTEEQRRKNVRGVFATDPKRSVRGSRILLVDDVYTSGATVNECSRALHRAGAREVRVLTLARAVF